jgi:hypothetical protein
LVRNSYQLSVVSQQVDPQSPPRKQGSISKPDAQAREYFKARRASKGVFASREKATLAGAAGSEDPALRDSLAGAAGSEDPALRDTLAGAAGSEDPALRDTLACASGFEDPALRDTLAGAAGFVSSFSDTL